MNNGSTIGQRFAQLITALKLSNNAFAKSLGKSSTTINYIVDEKNKPGFDVLEATLNAYPEVNPDWLIKGNGEMVVESKATSNTEESYLLGHLRALEENFKKLATQLENKDKQIDGMQRTIDALLGSGKGKREKSFRKPALETGRILELYPAEQSETKKVA